jgi:hypothetical protein
MAEEEVTVRSWLVRQVRGWLPDGNPLRRGTDRAGALIGVWLTVMAVMALVTVTPAVSHLAANSAAAMQRAQMSSRHQVTAVLLQRATPTTSNDDYPLRLGATITARWTYPAGQRHTGPIVVGENLRAGARVAIWVDQAGAVTSPPMNASQVAVTADLAGMGAVIVVVTVALCTGLGLRRALDRRRMAAWDAEWADAEERWHHQRW